MSTPTVTALDQVVDGLFAAVSVGLSDAELVDVISGAERVKRGLAAVQARGSPTRDPVTAVTTLGTPTGRTYASSPPPARGHRRLPEHDDDAAAIMARLRRVA